MDIETARYILEFYSHLLRAEELVAMKHTMHAQKINKNPENAKVTELYRKAGWLTKDQHVLDLLKDGYDAFQIHAAKKIVERFPQKIFLNLCPKCRKLARTPLATQCRYCGHQWRE